MSSKNKTKKIDGYLLAVIILALIFFGVYSYLSFSSSQGVTNIIFNSPDETANYWSASLFAEQGNFTEFSDSSLLAGDITSPRSLRIFGNYLVPTGFLGLPWLYGSLAKLFNSTQIIPYLTPFFAALAVVFFYFILRFIFSKKVSCLSAILLFIHPAWWYYATRGLLPNVLFNSLLLMAIYFFLRAIYKEKNISYMIAGIFLGLSLMVRAVEIVWVLPLFALLCLFYIKKINWTLVWLTPIFGIVTMLPMFYYNNILFGQPFSLGYQTNSSASLPYLLPFGFNWPIIKLHIVQYMRDLFHWYYIFVVLGLVATVVSAFKMLPKQRYRLLAWLVILLVVSSILIVYYGSWQFSDNPDPNAVTIGTSFVRYWLPIYMLLIPLIAIPIARWFRKSTLAWILFSLAVVIIFGSYAYQDVYLDKQEGVLAVRDTIGGYQQIADLVNKATPEQAIIIAKKSDKIFFPSRTVIYDLFYDVDYSRVAKLTTEEPVYLWDWQYNSADLEYLNKNTYQPHSLQIIPTNNIYDRMQLYEVIYVE